MGRAGVSGGSGGAGAGAEPGGVRVPRRDGARPLAPRAPRAPRAPWAPRAPNAPRAPRAPHAVWALIVADVRADVRVPPRRPRGDDGARRRDAVGRVLARQGPRPLARSGLVRPHTRPTGPPQTEGPCALAPPARGRASSEAGSWRCRFYADPAECPDRQLSCFFAPWHTCPTDALDRLRPSSPPIDAVSVSEGAAGAVPEGAFHFNVEESAATRSAQPLAWVPPEHAHRGLFWC
jgi:hypothetical protein